MEGWNRLALLCWAVAELYTPSIFSGVYRRKILGFLKKEIEFPMAQCRSSKITSMIKWIRTSKLSIKNSL